MVLAIGPDDVGSGSHLLWWHWGKYDGLSLFVFICNTGEITATLQVGENG